MPSAISDRRVVVIGAGITGTLTAWALSERGWSVTLLEAAHVGAGSSGRSAAGIRQQFSTPETVLGMRYSVQSYLDMASHTEEGICPLIQNGYLFLYDDEASWEDARARVAMQQEMGLHEVEAISTGELQHRFPHVGEKLLGGTWCPTDGFLLPDVIYQEGARLAQLHGARLFQNAPVIGARYQGEHLRGVETPKGLFEADLFVDATNAWTGQLTRILEATPLPVEPLKRYLWFLKRDGSMTATQLKRMPLTVTPAGTYCRPENPEVLMMGRKHDALPEPDFTLDDQDRIEPDFSHNTGIDTVPYTLWMDVAEALPPIGEFGGILATTSGYYGTTPDHNPYLDYDPRVPNLVRLVGFSGHGAMFGPFTAAVAVTLAETGHSPDDILLGDQRVSLDAFRIGRKLSSKETMVI